MNTDKRYTDPRVSDTRYSDSRTSDTNARVSDNRYADPAPIATKYSGTGASSSNSNSGSGSNSAVSDTTASRSASNSGKTTGTRIPDVRFFDNGSASGGSVQGVSDTQQCPDASGTLPGCAPLAVPYVPFQQKGSQRYSHADALNNGTLYPGLNLPFHLKVNAPNVVSDPLSELQALDFVVHELVLYLDTHPDDTEAFQLYRQYAATAQEARRQYEAANGPLTAANPGNAGRYVWPDDPWPWNLSQSLNRKGWGK